LYLRLLKLTNYKNYTSVKLSFNHDFIVFTGQNGAGKTNLLDAVYQLSFCKSNFQHRDALLVKTDEDFFRIEGHYRHDDDKHKSVIKYSKPAKKVTEFDGQTIGKMSDHVGRIPLVFIGPRDIQLFFDGSIERRRFMDSGISQLDKSYLQNLMVYNRVLAQRNSYLKSMPAHQIDGDLLNSYDKQLIVPARELFVKRKAFIHRFSKLLEDVYKNISNDKEQVTCEYKSQLSEHDMATLLTENRSRDLILQRTSQGIHKDDMVFKMNDRPLKQFGSEGQLKTFLLSMKLAMWHVIKNETTLSPILLLDDIFAKLDSNRVRNLLSYIQEYCKTQILITDTDQTRVSDILSTIQFNHEVYYIENNSVKHIHEA